MKFTINTERLKTLRPRERPRRMATVMIAGLASLTLVEVVLSYGDKGWYDFVPGAHILALDAIQAGISEWLGIVMMFLPLLVFPSTWGRLRRRIWDTFAVSVGIMFPFTLIESVAGLASNVLTTDYYDSFLVELPPEILEAAARSVLIPAFFGLEYGIPVFVGLYIMGYPTMYPVRGEW